MLSAELPWPHRDLSPNSRVHWSKRAKKAKKARSDACVIIGGAMARVPGAWPWVIGLRQQPRKIAISLQFIPAANHQYDLDGLISRMKSALDGISDALGINDRNFSFGKIEILSAQKPGKVIVTIASIDAG